MKQVSIFSLALLVCTITANAQPSHAQQVSNTKEPIYKMAFNNLSIGNPAYSQLVLQAWKDFDNNTLDNSAHIFADDVLITLPDGTAIKGKDKAMAGIKEYRSQFKSLSSQVHAVTTLKASDVPDREVVSIWGLETAVDKNGATTKTQLNEVWFINKAGKVIEMHQMAAKDSTPEKK